MTTIAWRCENKWLSAKQTNIGITKYRHQIKQVDKVKYPGKISQRENAKQKFEDDWNSGQSLPKSKEI